jgi:hypothetical protein
MALVASTMIRRFQSGTCSTSPRTDSKGTAKATTSAVSASRTSVGMTCGPRRSRSDATAAGPFEVATATSSPARVNWLPNAEPIAPVPMMAYFMTIVSPPVAVVL